MAHDLDFGARVKRARGDRTVAEVAHALSEIVGRFVHWGEIQRYEKGTVPGGRRLVELAAALSVPVESLFELHAQPSRSPPQQSGLAPKSPPPEVPKHSTSLAAFYRSGIEAPISEAEHRWLASHDYMSLPLDGWRSLLAVFRQHARERTDSDTG